MKGEYETIKEAGAEVVAVTPTPVELREVLPRDGRVPLPLVSDEELANYMAP